MVTNHITLNLYHHIPTAHFGKPKCQAKINENIRENFSLQDNCSAVSKYPDLLNTIKTQAAIIVLTQRGLSTKYSIPVKKNVKHMRSTTLGGKMKYNF